MSAIINSIIARQNGQASQHAEVKTSLTAGHRDNEPGLRGHSVGDAFPYGVTGYGDKWVVTKHGAPLVADWPTAPTKPAIYPCKLAHEIAQHLAERDELGLVSTDLIRAISWDDLANYV